MKEHVFGPSEISQELGRIIIENVRDFAIFAVDLDGRITSWNPGVENLLGYGEEEFVGRNFSIIFTAEDVADNAHRREIALAVTENRAEDKRWHVRRDGTRFFANGLTMALKDTTGNTTALAKILRDDTAHKQIEEEREELLRREREARAAVERAFQSNSEFLRLLSHELRNPLNAILGWTKLLRKNGLNSEQVGKALETIEQSAKLQARLIEDVFDISRISSGKLRIDPVQMNLSDAVNQSVASILPSAAAKNISVASTIESEEILTKGDPERIQQLISNLLTNAVKFTQEGGYINVSLSQSGSMAQIIIKDNGPGIAPEHLPFIFEPYSQINNKLERKESGLGLGLALVKHMAEMHGGTAAAESEGSGRGATFTITLPVSSIRANARS